VVAWLRNYCLHVLSHVRRAVDEVFKAQVQCML